jgi:hypothetical protein
VRGGDNWSALQRTSRPMDSRNAMERARDMMGEEWRADMRKRQEKALALLRRTLEKRERDAGKEPRKARK